MARGRGRSYDDESSSPSRSPSPARRRRRHRRSPSPPRRSHSSRHKEVGWGPDDYYTQWSAGPPASHTPAGYIPPQYQPAFQSVYHPGGGIPEHWMHPRPLSPYVHRPYYGPGALQQMYPPTSGYHPMYPPRVSTAPVPHRYPGGPLGYVPPPVERQPRYGERPWNPSQGVRRGHSPKPWANLAPPSLDASSFPPFVRDTHHPAPAVASMAPSEAEALRERYKIKLDCPFSLVPPNPCVLFQVAGFRSDVTEKLQAKFGAPTSIQAQGWPIVCSGHNLIAVGETGTGKTLTYIVPLVSHLEANEETLPIKPKQTRALILAPTRELCMQIQSEAKEFLDLAGFTTLLLIGGQGNRFTTEEQLAQRGEHVTIAAPGRLLDFVSRKKLDLSEVTYFVVDEADRLLNHGFEGDLIYIGHHIRPDRQTLLWTATWNRVVDSLANKLFDTTPIRMTIGSSEAHTVETIKHQFITVNEATERLTALIDFLRDKPEYRIIVFTTLRADCLVVEEAIKRELPNHLCALIHGSQRQEERELVMKKFEEGLINIIISTNLLGRGIDFKRVYAVVNYGIPREISDYVNQCGRTGRAGATGIAVTLLVAGEEHPARLDALEKVLTASGVPIPDELKEARQKKPPPPPPEPAEEEPTVTEDEPTVTEDKEGSSDAAPMMMTTTDRRESWPTTTLDHFVNTNEVCDAFGDGNWPLKTPDFSDLEDDGGVMRKDDQDWDFEGPPNESLWGDGQPQDDDPAPETSQKESAEGGGDGQEEEEVPQT